MRLTQRLLNYLHRVFDKDPDKFLALRLSYAGAMSWRVEEQFLYTVVSGGPGVGLAIDLSQFTIRQLVNHLAAQPGYSVLYMDGSTNVDLSARVLLDGGADIASSNGDHLYAYTNELFALLDAKATQLKEARLQVKEAIDQLTTKTADGEWLDELGSYKGVPRLAGEMDAQYAQRMIAEILRPRGNNVALEAAIKHFTGQTAKVIDVQEWGGQVPAYDGLIVHDGQYQHNTTAQPIYGLFDIEYGYDLVNGADMTEFITVLRDLVDRLRDAGTHLRSASLQGSDIHDDGPPAPTDGSAVQALDGVIGLTDTGPVPVDGAIEFAAVSDMADTVGGPADSDSVSVVQTTRYNGLRRFDGKWQFGGGLTGTGGLDGSGMVYTPTP